MSAKTIDGKGAAALLRQAVANIAAARELLDMTDQGCTSCGRHHWRNHMHAKVHDSIMKTSDSLTASARKLEAEADRIAEAQGAKEQHAQ